MLTSKDQKGKSRNTFYYGASYFWLVGGLISLGLFLNIACLWADVSPNAGKLLITEVSIKESNSWIELFVVDATVDWSGYRIRVGSQYKVAIPSGWDIQTGDYIVAHEESGSNDIVKSDNNSSCWDIYNLGNLPSDDQVIQLIEPSGSAKKVDCLIYSDNDGDFEGGTADANSAVAESMWDNYNFSTGDAGAWTDTDDIQANQTIARYMNQERNSYIDNNSKSDWYLSSAASLGGENDQSLPVFLTSFSATVVEDGILLHWRTSSEVDNSGFYIYRGERPESLIRISSLIAGAGNSDMPHDYQYVDQQVSEGKTYFYQLEDVDLNGVTTRHNIIKVVFRKSEKGRLQPKSFEVSPSYPNPFGERLGKPANNLRISLAGNESHDDFRVSIFNLLGEEIFLFTAFPTEAGEQLLEWNGLDASGGRVGSGIYFWLVQGENVNEVRKVMLIR